MTGLFVLAVVLVLIVGLLWLFPLRRFDGRGPRDLFRRQSWKPEPRVVVWAYRVVTLSVFLTLFVLVAMRS